MGPGSAVPHARCFLWPWHSDGPSHLAASASYCQGRNGTGKRAVAAGTLLWKLICD